MRFRHAFRPLLNGQLCILYVLLLFMGSTKAQLPIHPTNHTPANNKATNETSARAAFEQFKRLNGTWRGRSTKGWDEVVSYKTIAGESVVVANSFDAHPNETMMTMFYMDGERLILTHFCVARNQPRLVATTFADAGKTITFTFLDGTNLPSRDRGHMDKLVFRFVDDNHAVSHWTWYQNGKESWMEEIRLERIPPPAAKGH